MSGALLLGGAEWLPLLTELAAKATLILLLTAGVAALMWRRSAATRHMVWCVGVTGVLALPLMAAVVPAWEVPVLPGAPAAAAVLPAAALELPATLDGAAAATAAPAAAAESTPRAASVATSVNSVRAWLPDLAGALVALGVLIGLLWLAVGFWGVERLGRGAEVVRDPEWLRATQDAAERLGLRRPVLLLRGRGAVMPATWGLLWPSVILPSVAEQWPTDRRHAVLAHELAHVKRFDCLTQMLAQVACVLFWWHPAIWYAARRLRVERERACDDLVLRGGARASDYAAHLLEIARAYRGLRLGAPAMVSMAKPSQLESRLLWVLDGARARNAPSRRATLLAVSVGVLVVGPLAAMRPIASPAAASVLASADTLPSPAAPRPEPAPPAPPTPNAEPTPPTPGAEPEPFATVTTSVAPPAPPAPPSAPEPGYAWASASASGAVARSASGISDKTARSGRDTLPRDNAVDDLIAMRSVGVDAAYIREMRDAGYPDLPVRQLISLRAVGVTSEYAAQMNAAGFGRLSPEQLTSMRAIGVTPAYLAELGRAGYSGLSFGEVKSMRAVGVTAEYVEQMNRAGFGRLPAEKLISLRALGVTPGYLQELAGSGLAGLTLEQVQSLRAVGVTGAYIREMRAAGLGDLDARTLIKLRAVGVTPAYIREMKAAGFGNVTAADLIRLRSSGVDGDLGRVQAGTPRR